MNKPKPIKHNKTAMKIIVYLLIEGWEVNEIWKYLIPDRDRTTIQHLTSRAIQEYAKAKDSGKYTPKHVGGMQVMQGHNFKWTRQLTEDDLMSMPLPPEWRLPLFR